MDNLFFERSDLKSCGENVIIGKTVRIRKPEEVSIGNNVIIDDFTYISTSLEIGDYTHIGANNSIIGGKGHVKIGSFVNIAPSCQIVAGSNDYLGGGLVGPTIPSEFSGDALIGNINIGDHALFACNTTILPGVSIPEGMSTGAFTLVNDTKYEPWSLYVGVPAKYHKKRDGKKMIASANNLISKGK